jgi:hypothetical protein
MKGDRIRSRDLRMQAIHAYAKPIRSFDTSQIDASSLTHISETLNEDNGPGFLRMRDILRLVKLRAQVRRCALL